MATKVNINGKIVSRPGVYTLVKSGIKNTSPQLAAGNVCIIDDGIGAGFGGGVAGTVYSFDNVQDYQNFVKGGELWNLGSPLFKPLPGFNGVTKLWLVHARTGTSAVIDFNITAGNCSFTTIDQGLNANGVLDSVPELRKGYAAKLFQINAPTTTPTSTVTTPTAAGAGVAQVSKIVVANVHIGDTFTATIGANTVTFTAITTNAADVYTGLVALINANSGLSALVTAVVSTGVQVTAKTVNVPFVLTSIATAAPGQFQFNFYHGTYKEIDSLNNTPYDGVSEANAAPALLFQSPIVSTLDQLTTWAATSVDLKTGFTSDIGTGAITAADVAANAGYVLAAGGSEVYSDTAWQSAIAATKTLDTNFFLSMKFGNTDQTHTHNDDLLQQAISGKYLRFVMIGGGATKQDFDAYTVPAAKHFNSDSVILAQGDGKLTVRNGYKRVHSLYKAAAELGRLCGLDVQTPLTFKQIGIDAEWDALTDDQLEDALTYGVLASYFDDELGYTVVLEDVNTLQENEFLVNDDASSFNIAVKRIIAQLNKEMAITLKKKFFGNQNAGPNRNTMSEADVAAGAETFLQSRVANSQQDNYILKFQNISATFSQDNCFLGYEVEVNFEVSKLIVTGTLIDG